jgi:DNA-binding NtrC family response regulator
VDDNEEFIGSFETMKEVYKNIGIAAGSFENVFVYGDTGTGKELVSKLIHKNSQIYDKPFIAVNCSTIPENLFEKLMYGKAKNYFKDDITKHTGYVEQCKNGTLFLDGVCNLSRQSQIKLSRFLETKSYYPLGSSEELIFEGRIICTSVKTPKELLEDDNFKNDLYYKMSTLEIGLPSLEKRKADMKDLTSYFIKVHNKEFDLNYKGIEPQALEILQNHIFNGNIRELKSTIYKVMISYSKNLITAKNLREVISKDNDKDKEELGKICRKLLEMYEHEDIDKLFEDFEKEILKILFYKYQNISKLAKMMQISRNTLKEKLKKYHID